MHTQTQKIIKVITHSFVAAGVLLSTFTAFNNRTATASAITETTQRDPQQAEALRQPLAEWHSAGDAQAAAAWATSGSST